MSKEGKGGEDNDGGGPTSPQHKAWQLKPIANRLSEMKCGISNEASNTLLSTTIIIIIIITRQQRSQALLQRSYAPDVDEVGEVYGVRSGGFGLGQAIGDGVEGEVRVGGSVGRVEGGVDDGYGEAL